MSPKTVILSASPKCFGTWNQQHSHNRLWKKERTQSKILSTSSNTSQISHHTVDGSFEIRGSTKTQLREVGSWNLLLFTRVLAPSQVIISPDFFHQRFSTPASRVCESDPMRHTLNSSHKPLAMHRTCLALKKPPGLVTWIKEQSVLERIFFFNQVFSVPMFFFVNLRCLFLKIIYQIKR